MNGTAFLILEDGTIYMGTGFGAKAPTAEDLFNSGAEGRSYRSFGELIFNTGMSGYPEIITDPSYTGQLVVMTYPQIGNYGVDEQWSEDGAGDSSGDGAGLQGLIVRSLYDGAVPKGRSSLDAFLIKRNITGISGIDTRALTLKLRDQGSSVCVIVKPENGEELTKGERLKAASFLDNFPPMEGRNLIETTGVSTPREINSTGSPHFVVVDCGIKTSIVSNLVSSGCRVTVVPSTSTAEEILQYKSEGVLISNGPGDPAVLTSMIQQIAKLVGKTTLTGICLGHQLISLALGAETEKMKFGHHGINHPVRDNDTGRVFITSQNHGFTVAERSFTKGMKVWLVNSNDNSIEGMKHETLPILTTQFHPEAAPGPHDSLWIFDEFIKMAGSEILKEGE